MAKVLKVPATEHSIKQKLVYHKAILLVV